MLNYKNICHHQSEKIEEIESLLRIVVKEISSEKELNKDKLENALLDLCEIFDMSYEGDEIVNIERPSKITSWNDKNPLKSWVEWNNETLNNIA